MHRFYLSPQSCQSQTMVLVEREAHHALHVLRLREGDPVTILNGRGDIYSCKIAKTRKAHIELTVLDHQIVPQPPWRITLFQAIPKGKLFEDIVEKATEVGVHRIVPIISHRVVSTVERQEGKMERWNVAAIEAIKQCGSPWLPRIETPAPLEQGLATKDLDLSLVAALEPGAKHPRHWLEPLEKRALEIGVWVGPEGDFTGDELALLKKCGVRPMTLGKLVLRVETAAIYCLSVLNYELQWRSDR